MKKLVNIICIIWMIVTMTSSTYAEDVFIDDSDRSAYWGDEIGAAIIFLEQPIGIEPKQIKLESTTEYSRHRKRTSNITINFNQGSASIDSYSTYSNGLTSKSSCQISRDIFGNAVMVVDTDFSNKIHRKSQTFVGPKLFDYSHALGFAYDSTNAQYQIRYTSQLLHDKKTVKTNAYTRSQSGSKTSSVTTAKIVEVVTNPQSQGIVGMPITFKNDVDQSKPFTAETQEEHPQQATVSTQNEGKQEQPSVNAKHFNNDVSDEVSSANKHEKIAPKEYKSRVEKDEDWRYLEANEKGVMLTPTNEDDWVKLNLTKENHYRYHSPYYNDKIGTMNRVWGKTSDQKEEVEHVILQVNNNKARFEKGSSARGNSWIKEFEDDVAVTGGYTYIPLHGVMEAFDVRVSRDILAGEVVLESNDIELRLSYANDLLIKNDQPFKQIAGLSEHWEKKSLPLEPLAELFNLTVVKQDDIIIVK